MDGTTAWHLSKITYAVMSLEPTLLLNLLHCQTHVRRRAKCMSHVDFLIHVNKQIRVSQVQIPVNCSL